MGKRRVARADEKFSGKIQAIYKENARQLQGKALRELEKIRQRNNKGKQRK